MLAGMVHDRVCAIAQIEDVGIVTRAAIEHIVARAAGQIIGVIRIRTRQHIGTSSAVDRQAALLQQLIQRLCAAVGKLQRLYGKIIQRANLNTVAVTNIQRHSLGCAVETRCQHVCRNTGTETQRVQA